MEKDYEVEYEKAKSVKGYRITVDDEFDVVDDDVKAKSVKNHDVSNIKFDDEKSFDSEAYRLGRSVNEFDIFANGVYDTMLKDKEKYGPEMNDFLTKNAYQFDELERITLSEFFRVNKGNLLSMGCDSNDTHSKKDRFKNSVKGLIDSMGTELYSNVNLLGHTNLDYNYNDLGFAGALAITFLGLTFDDDFTAKYVKETLESMVKSEDLCAESLKTFYDGLSITRENRDKTPESQEEYYNSHSDLLTAKQKKELKISLAEEIGPVTPDNHRNAVTSISAYIRLKEYHENKSFFNMLFHPFKYHDEYKVLDEMKNVLTKKIGLSKDEVEKLNTKNTTSISDNITIVDKIFNNDPKAFEYINFKSAEQERRNNNMYRIKSNIKNEFEIDEALEDTYGVHFNEDIHPESNLGDNNFNRKKVTDYLDNNDKPISIHDENDYFVGEDSKVLDNYSEIRRIKFDLDEDNDQKEYDLSRLTEVQLEHIIDNTMQHSFN